jgi:hypothetical protein
LSSKSTSFSSLIRVTAFGSLDWKEHPSMSFYASREIFTNDQIAEISPSGRDDKRMRSGWEKRQLIN